jgi:hypothetical protein
MYLSEEDIKYLYNNMMSLTLPESLDKRIFNMYKQGVFSKEQRIECIKHNYPNKSDEFIEKKYNDIFTHNIF